MATYTTLPGGDQLITGAVSAETAHLCPDYPYGRTLRCQRKTWVETKKGHGQRFVSQTSNPKRGDDWRNKPHAGTYSTMQIMYIDVNTGYVEHKSIYASWLKDNAAIVEWLGPVGLAALSKAECSFLVKEWAQWQALVARDMKYLSDIVAGLEGEEKEVAKLRFVEDVNNFIAAMHAQVDTLRAASCA